MDHHIDPREMEVQHFQQIASGVRSDAEALGWIVIRLDVEDSRGVIPSVANLTARDSVSAD